MEKEKIPRALVEVYVFNKDYTKAVVGQGYVSNAEATLMSLELVDEYGGDPRIVVGVSSVYVSTDSDCGLGRGPALFFRLGKFVDGSDPLVDMLATHMVSLERTSLDALLVAIEPAVNDEKEVGDATKL